MLAVSFGALLAHQHARFDATRAADDAGDGAVVGLGAGHELAGILGINADNHAGFEWILEGIDVELFGEVAATGDLQFLGGDPAIAAEVGLQGDRGGAVALVELQVAAAHAAGVGVQLDGGSAGTIPHQDLAARVDIFGADDLDRLCAVRVIHRNPAPGAGAVTIKGDAHAGVSVVNIDQSSAAAVTVDVDSGTAIARVGSDLAGTAIPGAIE